VSSHFFPLLTTSWVSPIGKIKGEGTPQESIKKKLLILGENKESPPFPYLLTFFPPFGEEKERESQESYN
jgi:hypothetical protein